MSLDLTARLSWINWANLGINPIFEKNFTAKLNRTNKLLLMKARLSDETKPITFQRDCSETIESQIGNGSDAMNAAHISDIKNQIGNLNDPYQFQNDCNTSLCFIKEANSKTHYDNFATTQLSPNHREGHSIDLARNTKHIDGGVHQKAFNYTSCSCDSGIVQQSGVTSLESSQPVLYSQNLMLQSERHETIPICNQNMIEIDIRTHAVAPSSQAQMNSTGLAPYGPIYSNT